MQILNQIGCLRPVLFTAPQIPAGMTGFRWNPVESSGMALESTGMAPESTGMAPESTGMGLESTGMNGWAKFS